MNFDPTVLNDLVEARYLARDLERDISRDMAHSDSLSDVERIVARAYYFARALDQALILARSLSIARDADVHARAMILAGYLRSACHAARDLDRELDLKLGRGGRDRDRTRALVLAALLDGAANLVRDLEFQTRPDLIVAPVSEQGAKAPSAVSRQLTEWAARLLPRADQVQYAELFWSELYDLAQAGTGQWKQIRHALRVLARAPWLRRELRAPARERSW